VILVKISVFPPFGVRRNRRDEIVAFSAKDFRFEISYLLTIMGVVLLEA